MEECSEQSDQSAASDISGSIVVNIFTIGVRRLGARLLLVCVSCVTQRGERTL